VRFQKNLSRSSSVHSAVTDFMDNHSSVKLFGIEKSLNDCTFRLFLMPQFSLAANEENVETWKLLHFPYDNQHHIYRQTYRIRRVWTSRIVSVAYLVSMCIILSIFSDSHNLSLTNIDFYVCLLCETSCKLLMSMLILVNCNFYSTVY
jgi:hypothetical protein